MKKFLLPLLGCAVWLGGCSKGDDGLKRVANVTIKMDDPKFMVMMPKVVGGIKCNRHNIW